jgi:hypothetical protein
VVLDQSFLDWSASLASSSLRQARWFTGIELHVEGSEKRHQSDEID